MLIGALKIEFYILSSFYKCWFQNYFGKINHFVVLFHSPQSPSTVSYGTILSLKHLLPCFANHVG